MRNIVLVVHNVRSCHNVGSLLRTADGLGLEKVYLTGYTPYPQTKNDQRLPHLAKKLTTQINKTALGAQDSVDWEYKKSVGPIIKELEDQSFMVVALEQTPKSQKLTDFNPLDRVALVVGNEVDGLDSKILDLCSAIVEVPMLGAKESFNVAVAAGMALYHLRYRYQL